MVILVILVEYVICSNGVNQYIYKKGNTIMPKKSFADVKYEINEILGVASEDAGLHSDWCKAVLKTLMDEEDGIDIRRFNAGSKMLGKGIRLTVQEAHNVADILISNGYGSMKVIEEEYNRRKSLFEGDE